MNRKIVGGLLIIFMSLFYLFQKYIPESILMYVFNYQIILVLLGIYFILQKKNTLGISLSLVGLYLYFQEFFTEYFEIAFPLITLVAGVVIFVLGLNEKNKKSLKKQEPVYKSTYKADDSKKTTDIEDAEEIK